MKKSFPLFLLLIGLNLGAQNLPPELQPLVAAPDPATWLKANPKIRLPFIKGPEVTFLYQDTGKNPVESITLLGDEPEDFGQSDQMVPLKGTKWFFLTLTKSDLDGLVYTYRIKTPAGSSEALDPLNPIIHYAKPLQSMIRTQDSPFGTIQVMNVKPLGINNKRDVWVYLPAGYFAQSEKRYPVLYMQDGQQIWDSNASANGGWKANTTQEALVKAGKVEPFIIVGIKNSSRRNEEYIGYSAYYGAKSGTVDEKIQNESFQYARDYVKFVSDELKPMIDKMFRTKADRNNTAVAGSSFGAGVSLNIGFTRSDVFSKIGSFSGGNYEGTDESRKEKNFYQVFPYLIEKVINKKNPMKIYVDCGGRDVDAIFLPRTLDLVKALKKIGFLEGKDLKVIIDEDAGHNEKEWARRLGGCFEFLFGI